MTSFLGEYEVALDAKGRFLMPAAFRRQLPENAETARFVLNRGLDACLTLYPLTSWEIFKEKVSKLNEFNREARMLKRKILGGATYVELDSAGRLLLPKPLMEYANLQKEIMFVAQDDKVEIWNKQQYLNYMDTSGDDLEALAERVLGSNFLDE